MAYKVVRSQPGFRHWVVAVFGLASPFNQIEGSLLSVDPTRKRPAALPIRWALIIGLSAAVGIVVGMAEGLPAGLLATLVAAGALHKIVD